MEQTRLLLISAREDYSQALNILCLVEMHEVPTTVGDIMYAYMVAKDWCKWIKNPGESGENPLQHGVDDSLLRIFEKYAEDLENQLVAYQNAIEEDFSELNPNLVNGWRSLSSMPILKEDTRLFFRTLRYTAQIFEDRFRASFLNQMLDKKQVPPMCELDKCPTDE